MSPSGGGHRARASADAPRRVRSGSGRRTRCGELLGLVWERTGAEVEGRYDPPRQGGVCDGVAGLARRRNALGYAPRVDHRGGPRRSGDGVAARESAS